MNLRRITAAGALLAGLLSIRCGLAQKAARTDLGRSTPCPFPARLIIHGHDPVTIMPAELPPAIAATVADSNFSHVQTRKNFGYTFAFPVCPQECCAWTTGYLQVTFKALRGGPGGPSASASDRAAIYVNGAAVIPSQNIWPEVVAADTVKTTTFAVPGSALTHGHLSLVIEQNTAVISAQLTLEGCCLCGK